MRRRYFAVTGLCLALALISASINILYREWQGGFSSLYLVNQPFNWFSYYFDLATDKLIRPFKSASEPGLPAVQLFVPERARAALMEDIPASTKRWQKAYMLYPDSRLKKIKVRHRGDNPINWMYEKKSWRIKTTRKRTLGGTRTFNYIVLQKEDFLGDYLAYWLGRKANILTPRVRLVEMFINEESYGLYLEAEHLDESFLRNAGRMPGNIYKGEQYNSERIYGSESDLFNNPSLWTKTAVFNQFPEADQRDLEHLFNLVRQAETSEADFKALREIAPFDQWALFSAFQILVQSWHNNRSHNMRLAADPWYGSIVPIIHDTGALYFRKKELGLERSSQPLLNLYLRSSPFLVEQYRQLRRLLFDEQILQAAGDHVRSILPALERTMSRDRFMHQLIHTIGADQRFLTDIDRLKKVWQATLSEMDDTASGLKNILATPTPFYWWHDGRSVGLTLDGPMPIENVRIELGEASNAIRGVYWDADLDGKISDNDINLPITAKDGSIEIAAAWTSNRAYYNAAGRPAMDASSGELHVRPTTFRLLFDAPAPVAPKRISYVNLGSETPVSAVQEKREGLAPGRWNRPVVAARSEPERRLVGQVEFKQDQIFEQPVHIAAGTQILLHPGVSMIFKNRVQVDGTEAAPVEVRPAVKDRPWGVIALIGPKTASSRVRHLSAAGGSGDDFPGLRVIGMLSVHNTKDAVFEGLHLEGNVKTVPTYDDMIHVVYSQGIVFRDLNLKSASSDALDIDLSQVKIYGGRIEASGNDGIDAMTSSVLVEDVSIENSGDKGISVGERSEVSVVNVRLARNVIGAQSKDQSELRMLNTDLDSNGTQLNAYWKNWRYQSGGKIVAEKILFSGQTNKLSADKTSAVEIRDSGFSTKPEIEGTVTVDEYSDFDFRRGARISQQSAMPRKTLEQVTSPPRPDQRGMQ